jgi:hypothetical protein
VIERGVELKPLPVERADHAADEGFTEATHDHAGHERSRHVTEIQGRESHFPPLFHPPVKRRDNKWCGQTSCKNEVVLLLRWLVFGEGMAIPAQVCAQAAVGHACASSGPRPACRFQQNVSADLP